MKKPLLFILFLGALFSAQSQSTLHALNGVLSNSGLPMDGYNYRSYVLFTPETVFDQSSAGFDKTWDISGFTVAPGSKYYSNTDATPAEEAAYPGTGMVSTAVVTNSEGANVASKAYTLGSIMGLTAYNDTSLELTLNYDTDNIHFGSYPLTYGDLHLDNTTSGTYVFGAYTGTFVGTFISEVDAYGTMITATDGNVDVTRLKTIETLQISYPGFGNVGTYVQTTYRYYRPIDLWPYVKSTNTVIDIGVLNLNTNTTSIEKAPAAILSTPDLEFNNSISVFPNPATNLITITNLADHKIVSVAVIDLLGKTVLNKNETNRVDISGLENGTYLVKIQTDNGTVVKKVIKK